MDYNINMRLVDKSDAMISAIDCARKTIIVHMVVIGVLEFLR